MVYLIPLNLLIPLAILIILLIIILWILYKKNKKVFKTLSIEKKKLSIYKNGLQELKTTSKEPNKDFKKLNKLTRSFLKEYFNLSQSKTYLELATHFKKQNQPEYTTFCKLMSKTEYSGNKITKEKLDKLVSMVSKIVEGI